MNLKTTFIVLFVFCFFNINAQRSEPIYNPKLDGLMQIEEASKKAKIENKYIYVQIGGNWCPWCVRLHKYLHEETKIDSILNANYIPVFLNYSKDNKNLEALKTLDNPQRFGFPVIVILDNDKNIVHTQDSWYIEKDKSYDFEKVKRFLLLWNKNNFN